MTLTRKTIGRSIALAAFGFLSTQSFSQILTSGFYPNQGQLTVATTYTSKQSDNFWAGNQKQPGNPGGLGEITSNVYSLFAEYGITDRISVDVSLPYIENEYNNEVVEGLQDINIFAKFKIFEKSGEGFGRFNLGVATGIGFPVSDYDGGGVISLGNAATSYNFDFIAQYELPFNLFVEVQGGSSVRDSDEFDVPPALSYGFKIGYFHKYFYVHSELDIQDSIYGLDIGTAEFIEAGGLGDRPNPAILPLTEVDFTSLSFSAYVPIIKEDFGDLGLSGSYKTTLDGRNFNNESSFSIGIVYQNSFKEKKSEEITE
ncbi:hypothetical protein [Aquimarina agarivorans]|uniref:hypothetical protein n=1 Tax=Aquimarina agarivorans TaxID=980584 RepID=UPI000248F886|nr:hypothetical protein [Aquimarina agarivorans]